MNIIRHELQEPINTIPRIITIDGDSATGKTTLSELVAERLGYMNVTGGMLYCAGALAVEWAGVDTSNDQAIIDVVQGTDFSFDLTTGQRPLLSIDGRDVTGSLFMQKNKQNASRLSSIQEVNDSNEARLKHLAMNGRWVFDRGMNLFPNAELKIWLTASPYVRAARRCAQLALEGEFIPFGRVLEENAIRSKRDSKRRQLSPDVVTINTTDLTIESVYSSIVAHVFKDKA